MKKVCVIFLLTAILSLGACGVTKKTLGFANSGPDETKVKTNPPLTLPPEYNVRPSKNILSVTDEENGIAE